MSNDDLWDFAENPIPTIKTPAAILKDQVDAFNRAMSSMGLFAEFQKRSTKDSSRLSFFIDIVVPNLGDYRLRVVSVSFSVNSSYPVRIASDYGEPRNGSYDAAEEQELVRVLRTVLSDQNLKSSMASLIANSNL